MITVMWQPLYPGEEPGDPELGGWRPLLLRRGSAKQRRVSLLEALRLLVKRIERQNVTAAINFVALKIA